MARTTVWFGVLLLLLMTTTEAQPPRGCKEEIDLAFLVDNSASIREDNPYDGSYDNWKLVKDFIADVVTIFRVKRNATRTALARFSSRTHVELRFTDMLDLDSVQRTINYMPYSGQNTHTADGLRVMHQDIFKYSRYDADKILVIMSDGLSNINVHKTLAEAGVLKTSKVRLFTVALTSQYDQAALTQIASYPAYDHHLAAGTVRSLHLLVPQLVHRICGFEPPPLCPVGEYFDGEVCTDCLLQVDLAILMDDSGSIRDKNPADGSYDNFKILKTFIQNLISRLPVGHNETRVAIIRFSTTTRIELRFSQYDTEYIEQTIDRMIYNGGTTSTGEAIHQMRTEIFRRSQGDRPEAKNVAILITDGESSNSSQTLMEASLAKQEDVRFFTVGITNQINETELKLVASSPSEDHFYNSTNFHQLNSLLTKLIKHVCRGSLAPLSRQARDVSHMKTSTKVTVNQHQDISDDGWTVVLPGSLFWSVAGLTTVTLICVVLFKTRRNTETIITK